MNKRNQDQWVADTLAALDARWGPPPPYRQPKTSNEEKDMDSTYTPHPVTVTIQRGEHDNLTHKLSFHLSEYQTTSVHLTQGELISLWQEIGAYFNLAGMGDAKREASR